MPTYSYKCQNCGHRMEAFQGINDPRLTKCQKCSEDMLKQVPSLGLGFVLNGGGFYETDYKSASCCPCGKTTEGCGKDN